MMKDRDQKIMQRNGPKKLPRLFYIIALMGFGFLFHYFLTYHKLDNTAALYIGLPFLLALGLSLTPKAKSITGATLKILTICLLLSAPILREGYICILLAAPIILGIGSFIALQFDIYYEKKAKNKTHLTFIIMLLGLPALEGTHESLTFDRNHQAEYTKIINYSIAEIRQEIATPPKFTAPRPLFLRLFPLPEKTSGSGLKIGDQRRLSYTYYKWFYFNPHKGETLFEVTQSEPNYIRFAIKKDDSYIANYLTWHRSEIFLTPLTKNKTKVTWRLSFTRKLDPAWYFAPMQKYASWLTCQTLIDNLANQIKADRGGSL